MRTAEALKIIQEKFGLEISEAIITYIDDIKEDKISLLREENRNLHLETRLDQEKQISGLRQEFIKEFNRLDLKISDLQVNFLKELRSQTVWIIGSIFTIAALVMAGVKLL